MAGIDMTSSHSEKHILEGCIALMTELTDSFAEWLEWQGIEVPEEERFCHRFYYTEIVERLFLWHTHHSGGTSQRMKCEELGVSGTIDFDVKGVEFDEDG